MAFAHSSERTAVKASIVPSIVPECTQRALVLKLVSVGGSDHKTANACASPCACLGWPMTDADV
jgi:hypothetical protein